ncbi:diguanylate cyclase (GGDEF)-like protein [Allocatelliglobosispora scoriae]|uniref:Diguanylate cyclase (GGDEF)-like protein n=1 Tax=Allocatelliglobosispora scoriae TaxID=643052 RepID=A0A841BRL2_9ACTN|nr:EAL domain-containing protein [Allocatelliglobosispora scoriae]MBB5870345.1 diguanylate cyclase (GGDEF)-like protein [Allocatelliglobosispora scoriae]
MFRISGAADLPQAARWLVLITFLGGLAAAVGGFVISPISAWDDFAIVVGLVCISQLGRLRMPIGRTTFSTGWGEAALIVSLYLVPAGWVPAAVGLGVILAKVLLMISTDEPRSLVDLIRSSASLTLASAPAVVVAEWLSNPSGATLNSEVVVGLVAAALVYFTGTAILLGLHFRIRDGLPIGAFLKRALSSGSTLMMIGNLVVGLIIFGLLENDRRWLISLPPVLWLLQQTYTHRLRDSQERQGWQEFASVTKALQRHSEEPRIAESGVEGALRLFDATEVELDVLQLEGGFLRYSRHPGDPAATVTKLPIRPTVAGDPMTVARDLEFAGGPVGTLTLRFASPAAMRPRDHSAFAAFTDALAVALHDAATHAALRRATDQVADDSVRDPLTGLLNRGALLQRGDETLRGLPRGLPVALLLLDVDNFKEINNTLGHLAGDELLQIAANRLSDLVSDSEILARLGGDEYGLLLTDLPDDEPGGGAPLRQAMRRARRVAAALAEPAEVAGVTVSTETAIGVVAAVADRIDMSELLRRADIALHEAKEGGTRVVSYAASQDEASTDRLALVAELRSALDVHDQIVLALQPAIDLATGAATGVEALVRWRHPRRGKLNPIDFVRTVEASELLGPFTRYVIDKALASAAEWGLEGVDVPVSVNLSARSLLDPKLPSDVAELLKRHQVPPRRLVLEITETVVMSDLRVIDEVLGELRELGVQLSVDDFGTGYSSLTFLTRIAVDEVKVDRSFVRAMADSPEAAAIVRTTVDLGRQLGLRVVAEGVETHEQRRELTRLGCTAAQGFHFFRPMPADEITAALRSLPEQPTPDKAAESTGV